MSHRVPTVEASRPRRRGPPRLPVERARDQCPPPDRRAAASASPPAATTSCARPRTSPSTYAINPWMHPEVAVDTRARARPVGAPCARTYRELGHRVELIDPVPGLPDMVYAANGATVRRRPGVRRPVPLRGARAEADAAPRLVPGRGLTRGSEPRVRQRGRGRLPARRRRDPRRHRVPHRPARATPRLPEVFGREVVTLRAGRPALLPPRHRAGRARRPDDDRLLPGAFSPGSRARAGRLLPRRGARHRGRRRRARPQRGQRRPARRAPGRRPPASRPQLAERGYDPIPVDLSELLQGRRRSKCCTLEMRGVTHR